MSVKILLEEISLDVLTEEEVEVISAVGRLETVLEEVQMEIAMLSEEDVKPAEGEKEAEAPKVSAIKAKLSKAKAILTSLAEKVKATPGVAGRAVKAAFLKAKRVYAYLKFQLKNLVAGSNSEAKKAAKAEYDTTIEGIKAEEDKLKAESTPAPAQVEKK